MTEEGSAARLLRNTLTNGGGAAFGVLVFLVLTPFMILELGAEAFGVFTLALSLSILGGYAALLDFGVESATARFVAEARAVRDVDRVNQLASTAMLFCGSVALLLAPVVSSSALLAVSVFDVSPELRDEAVVCLAFVGAQLLFELPARTYFAVLTGVQRFGAYQACELFRVVTQASMFTAVLVFDLGVGALGMALALSSLLVLVLARHLAHRVIPELRLSPRQASRQLLRTMLSYAVGLLGLRVLVIGNRQMDRLILGASLGLRSVTVYEIANRVQMAAQVVQQIAASALVPAAAFARSSLPVLQDMFLRGTTYTLGVSLPFVVAVAVFADPLIAAWINPDFTEAAGPTRVFALYLLLTSVVVVGATMTIALGHVRFMLAVNAPAFAANLLISLTLVGPLGIYGVIIGTVASGLAAFPLQLRFFLRRFAIPWTMFVRRSLLPQVPGLLAQSAAAVPLLVLAERSGSIVVVGLLALVSCLASGLAFVLVGLPGEHRVALVETVRSALRP